MRQVFALVVAFTLFASGAAAAANNSDGETDRPTGKPGKRQEVLATPAAERPGGQEAVLASIPPEAIGHPFVSAGIAQKEFDDLKQKADALIDQIEKGTAAASIKLDDIEGRIVVTLTSDSDRNFAIDRFGNDPKVEIRFAESVGVSLMGDPGMTTNGVLLGATGQVRPSRI